MPHPVHSLTRRGALAATLATAALALPGVASAQWKPTQADHHHRALVGRRCHRPDHAPGRVRARRRPGPEDRRRQPARRRRLDRHQGGDGRAQGRLHLDRRRGQAARHLPGAGHDQQQARRLPPLPGGDQCVDRQRQPVHALPDLPAAARGDEGRPAAGRHRGQQLVGSLRDGGHRQGHRRQVPPRDLRRRQPGRGLHRVRRDPGHDPARARAGRDDQGQAPAAARRRRRRGR